MFTRPFVTQPPTQKSDHLKRGQRVCGGWGGGTERDKKKKKAFERILFMTGAALKVTRGNEISKPPLLPLRDCASCPLDSRCENVIKIAFSSDTPTAALVPPTASARSPAVQLHGSAAVHKQRDVARYRRLTQTVGILNCTCCVSLQFAQMLLDAQISLFIIYVCVYMSTYTDTVCIG